MFKKLCVLLTMFVLFTLGSNAQKNVHTKINTWDIVHNGSEWTFQNNNGYYNDKCISKMRLTFTNSSQLHVSKITIMLSIIDCSGVVVYKKKHTVSVDLDPEEKSPCKTFSLFEDVCNYDCGFSNGENVQVNADILSVK